MLLSLRNGRIQMSEGKRSILRSRSGQTKLSARPILMVGCSMTDFGQFWTLPELSFQNSKNSFVKLGILCRTRWNQRIYQNCWVIQFAKMKLYSSQYLIKGLRKCWQQMYQENLYCQEMQVDRTKLHAYHRQVYRLKSFIVKKSIQNHLLLLQGFEGKLFSVA